MAIAAPRSVIAAPFNGSAVAVDTAGYLAQHEVVYDMPPRRFVAAMPLGDGDLTAMLWCPGDEVRIEVNKSDLWWNAEAQGGPSSASQMLGVGSLSFRTDPAPVACPEAFEQRLSLYSAAVTLNASADPGACRVHAWVAATGNVLCVHYTDTLIKGSFRYVEVHAPRNARPFAINEHIGLIEVLPDRRSALVCCVLGTTPSLGWTDAGTPRFELQSARGIGFTLLAAVAVTGRDGDPVSAAKARLAAAMRPGVDALWLEHRQHWRAFWQKSFLRLTSPDGLAEYAENLWYLNLYQMASCGINDYPVAPDCPAWCAANDEAVRSAAIPLRNTQMLYWPFYAANHLEIPERFAEFVSRVRPTIERNTRAALASDGLCVPEVIDRTGGPAAPAQGEGDAGSLVSLECAVLFYWRWRYSDDRDFLKRHAYPFLKGCMAYHLGRLRARGGDCAPRPDEVAPLRFGLEALLDMAGALDADAELRDGWRELLTQWPPPVASDAPDRSCGNGVVPYASDVAPVFPFGWVRPGGPEHTQALLAFRRDHAEPPDKGWSLDPIVAARLGLRDTVQSLVAEWIERFQAFPQGFFAIDPVGVAASEPRFRLEPAAVLATALNEMCLQGHGGVLRLFPAIPWDWDGVFSLRSEGGFRVMAQIASREVVWAAIESLTGQRCRLANPWDGVARVQVGYKEIVRSDEPLLEFQTERGVTYTVDRPDRPLSRMLRIRLTGRHAAGVRAWGNRRIGLD